MQLALRGVPREGERAGSWVAVLACAVHRRHAKEASPHRQRPGTISQETCEGEGEG